MAYADIKLASGSFKNKKPFEPKMVSEEKIGFSINGVGKTRNQEKLGSILYHSQKINLKCFKYLYIIPEAI